MRNRLVVLNIRIKIFGSQPFDRKTQKTVSLGRWPSRAVVWSDGASLDSDWPSDVAEIHRRRHLSVRLEISL